MLLAKYLILLKNSNYDCLFSFGEKKKYSYKAKKRATTIY